MCLLKPMNMCVQTTAFTGLVLSYLCDKMYIWIKNGFREKNQRPYKQDAAHHNHFGYTATSGHLE